MIYCYAVPSIDFWIGTLPRVDLFNAIRNEHPDRAKEFIDAIVRMFGRAMSAFRSIGWEGDLKVPPRFFAVPGASETLLGVIVKQNADNKCFIASPCALPHVQERAFQTMQIIQ